MTSHLRIELTDELIERTLGERAGSRAPEDIVEAIISAAATTPQRRRRLVPALPRIARSRATWLMVGVLLALLGISAAIAVGSYLLRQRTTVVPAVLQAEWRPVGQRQHPTLSGETIPLDLDIVIDASTITIFEFHGDVVSSMSLVGSDGLDLRTLNSPAVAVPGQSGTPVLKPYWDCRVGDAARYAFRLSPSGLELTLTPLSDSCAERATILAGDWFRTDNGHLMPGHHDATLFKPLGGGTSGRFSFTVPPDWAVVGEQMSSSTSIVLGKTSGPTPNDPVVLVLANVVPGPQAVACAGSEAVAGMSPLELARWLTSLPGLVVTTPTPVTIGGLSGVTVDLSAGPDGNTACDWTAVPILSQAVRPTGQRMEDAPLYVAGGQRARYHLLDAGQGVVLLVAVEAPDQAAWESVIADATSIIESFEFTR